MDRERVSEIAESRAMRFGSLMSQSGFGPSTRFQEALAEEFFNCGEDDYEDQDDFSAALFLVALQRASAGMRL